MQNIKLKSGFTLLELLIVLAIISILMSSGLYYARTTIVNSQFNTVVNEIKESLLSSINNSRQNYLDVKSGVAFRVDGFTLFTANTYSDTDSRNYDTELPPTITLSNFSFGGNPIVYFEKYSGLPSSSGSLKVNHEDSRQAVIAVDNNGVVSVTFN